MSWSLIAGRWSLPSPYDRLFWFATNELIRLITNNPKTAPTNSTTIKALTSTTCTLVQVSLQSVLFLFNNLQP